MVALASSYGAHRLHRRVIATDSASGGVQETFEIQTVDRTYNRHERSIFKRVGESVQKKFGYVPGKDVEEALPLVTFKQEEFSEIEE